MQCNINILIFPNKLFSFHIVWLFIFHVWFRVGTSHRIGDFSELCRSISLVIPYYYTMSHRNLLHILVFLQHKTQVRLLLLLSIYSSKFKYSFVRSKSVSFTCHVGTALEPKSHNHSSMSRAETTNYALSSLWSLFRSFSIYQHYLNLFYDISYGTNNS